MKYVAITQKAQVSWRKKPERFARTTCTIGWNVCEFLHKFYTKCKKIGGKSRHLTTTMHAYNRQTTDERRWQQPCVLRNDWLKIEETLCNCEWLVARHSSVFPFLFLTSLTFLYTYTHSMTGNGKIQLHDKLKHSTLNTQLHDNYNKGQSNSAKGDIAPNIRHST